MESSLICTQCIDCFDMRAIECSLFCIQCIDCFDMRTIECSLFCIQCIDCFDIPWNLVYFVHNVSTASTCFDCFDIYRVWLESPGSQAFQNFIRIENLLNIKKVMGRNMCIDCIDIT